MSKIALEGNSLGTGTFTIAAPNSNSSPTLTLPTSSGTIVVTGGAQTIEFAAGTAAAPSITFTGDTNTGIFSPGADTIAFSEGGVESMRIDSSGNVGIGTNSPTQRLDVVAANSQIHFGAATTGGGYLMSTANGQFRISGGAVWDGSNWIAKSTTASIIGDDATGDIKFLSNTSLTAGNSFTPTERMRIDSSGNVGIGTSSPLSASNYVFVTVQGGSSGGGYILYNSSGSRIGQFTQDSTTAYLGNYSNNPLVFQTNNTERARITSGGSFLIGATATVGGTAERLNVTATGNSPAIIAISSSGSVDSTIPTWNKATSGDNLFLQFYTEGAATLRGSIDYNRGAGQTRYNITSDATLKNIIGDANGQKSLEILNSTRIREYAWKNDPTQKPQVGVIAQELYETYKGAVSVGGDFERERDVTEEVEEEYTDEEGNTQTRIVTKVVGKETYTEYRPWGVDKTAFTFHLIAGWQAHEKLLKEAMTRIEALEAEVAALKGQ